MIGLPEFRSAMTTIEFRENFRAKSTKKCTFTVDCVIEIVATI